MKYDLPMRVMGLNEEMEKMLYYDKSSKPVRRHSEGRSTERASGWAE